MKGSYLVAALVVPIAACSASSTSPSPRSAPDAPTASPSSAPGRLVVSPSVAAPTPSPARQSLPALVGQWQLDRTCEALVAAVTRAGYPELIERVVSEVVEGASDDGTLPASWDPKQPCAQPKVSPHSHTFWADGRFNSYDEREREVDSGRWTIVDDRTFRIDEWSFRYTADRTSLTMEPVVPAGCSGACLEGLGWTFSVSFPGQTWTRVTSGQHVPPDSGG